MAVGIKILMTPSYKVKSYTSATSGYQSEARAGAARE